MLKLKVFNPDCCDCDCYLPVIKRKIGDCWHSGYVEFLPNLEFHPHLCHSDKLASKEVKSTRAVKVSKYRNDRIKWHLNEISKHMADLSAEFEELFDPYLPVASKLKIKSCPGFGTVEYSESEPSLAIEIPSSYHGNWKIKVGVNEKMSLAKDEASQKCVTVNFDIME